MLTGTTLTYADVGYQRMDWATHSGAQWQEEAGCAEEAAEVGALERRLADARDYQDHPTGGTNSVLHHQLLN